MGVFLRLGTMYFTQAFTQTQKHLHGLTDSHLSRGFRRLVLRLLLWHCKAVESFALLHGQFDLD